MVPIQEKRCSSCNKVVSRDAKAGQKCPHCGAYWGFEQDGSGRKTYEDGGGSRGWLWGLLTTLLVVAGVAAKLFSKLRSS